MDIDWITELFFILMSEENPTWFTFSCGRKKKMCLNSCPRSVHTLPHPVVMYFEPWGYSAEHHIVLLYQLYHVITPEKQHLQVYWRHFKKAYILYKVGDKSTKIQGPIILVLCDMLGDSLQSKEQLSHLIPHTTKKEANTSEVSGFESIRLHI